jgi:hypothetical protein
MLTRWELGKGRRADSCDLAWIVRRPDTMQNDVSTADGWIFEATRACTQCHGSGKNPAPLSTGPARTAYGVPVTTPECPACEGMKLEHRNFTLDELSGALARQPPGGKGVAGATRRGGAGQPQ